MNSHEGVSCDQCMKSNFSGNRYKCLICYDFDLCHSCYSKNRAALNAKKTEIPKSAGAAVAPQQQQVMAPPPSSTHLITHPMQCILTKADYELHYGNGNGGGSTVNDYLDQLSFTCPYCGKIGLSEVALSDHLSKAHDEQQNLGEVVCPICAVLSSANGGDPNHLTDDLLHHINLEHLEPFALDENGLREVSGLMTNTTASAVAAAAALRFSRRLNNTSNSASNNNNSTNPASSSSSSNRIMVNRPISSRYQAFPGGSLSSFMRSTSNVFDALGAAAAAAAASGSSNNANDPIAELLSQLAGVRRATNVHASNLHILQSQLTRERGGGSGGGDGQHQSAAAAAIAAAAAAAAAASNTGTGGGVQTSSGGGGSGIASYLANSHYSSNLSRASNNPFFASSNSNKLKSSNVNSSGGGAQQQQQQQQQNASSSSGGANNIINAMLNQALELPGNLFCQPLPPNSRDSRYLLSKYDFSTIDNQQATLNSKLNPFAQSLFINDVLLSLFITQMSDATTSSTSSSNNSSGSTKNHNQHQQPQQQPLAAATETTATNESIIQDLLVEQQQQQQQKRQSVVETTTESI